MEDNKNQNETTRSGFVTLIGRPNVGKSTLMNHLIGQKIAITSKKPQTTRNRIRTVYTDERGQIVFLDTPGMHKVKNKLGTYMEDVVLKTIKEVDLILWLVEPTTYVGAGEQEIVKLLKQLRVPVLLVINKTDTIQKEEITQVLATYNSLMNFAGVVCVSALKDKGVDDVLTAIFEHLPYGPVFYDEDTVTDQTMRQIAAELIREQALRLLSDEIPHGIAVEIDRMKERNESLTDIDATIICERESHKGIIIGKGGAMLKKIGSGARTNIEEMLELQVTLKRWVKVRENWRDDPMLLSSLGYDPKELKGK